MAILFGFSCFGVYSSYSFHGRNEFGREVDTTSKIEGTWANLKRIIKKIYNYIQLRNLVYFIKEVESIRKIKYLNSKEKLNEFSVVISCVGNGITDAFLSEDDLISIEYDNYF